MNTDQLEPNARQRLQSLERVVAVLAVWLLVVGAGTECFFPYPRGAAFPPMDDLAGFHNMLGFASSAAIAGALAAAAAFAVAGKKRWACELLVAVASTCALFAAAAYVPLWLAPGIARSRMGHWEFERLRRSVDQWFGAIVAQEIPVGTVVGLVVGTVAGLIGILARRRPVLAGGLTLGLLFACALEPVQRAAFGVVLVWGQLVDRSIVSPGMGATSVPEAGAAFGAIAGAILAVAVTRSTQGNTALARSRP